jgi:hypothetical protein
MLDIFNFHVFLLLSLAKSSYGWSQFELHHKFEKQHLVLPIYELFNMWPNYNHKLGGQRQWAPLCKTEIQLQIQSNHGCPH